LKEKFITGLFFLLIYIHTCASGIKQPDALVISEKVKVSLTSNKLITTTFLLLQINSREGLEAAEFELTFSATSKLKDLEGSIRDTLGTIIRKLEKNQITTKSNLYDAFYSDEMIKKFELKHNQFPYRIYLEYSYITSQFLHIADWCPVSGTDIPVQFSTLTVDVPADYPVKIFQQKLEMASLDTTEGIVRRTWSVSQLKPIKHESFDQPLRDIMPWVLVVPVNFNYGIKGSFDTWKSFGEYIDGLMAEEEDLPATETIKIKNLVQGVTDSMEMIKILFRYLQENTRYINVSVDIGGMKPYPASYVAQNKYGDCKALTLFMKSILSVIGIRSNYTLVYGDALPVQIITGFPAQQFNHVILCVPFRSDTLWLDCTSKELPAGYTSVFIQGRPALVISAGKSKLVQIPAMSVDESLVLSTWNCADISEDALDINLHRMSRGAGFEHLLNYAFASDRDQMRTIIKEQIPFKNYDLLNYQVTLNKPDTRSISLTAAIKAKGRVQTVGEKTIIDIPNSLLPGFEPVASRENPLFFPYPVYKVDTIVIHLPAKTITRSFPATKLPWAGGYYSMSSSMMGENLVCIRTFTIKSGYYRLDQYAEFYNWISSVGSFERQNKIVLTHE